MENTTETRANGHSTATDIKLEPAPGSREARIDPIVDVLIEMAAALADHPDDVEVNVVSGQSDNIILELRGHRDDIGKFIGKRGHHARAIRTIAQSVARKNGFFCKVEFVQPEEQNASCE